VNDVGELKKYVVAHAEAQGIPPARYREVLARIHHDEDGVAGSWAREWAAAGQRLERDGALLDAVRCYGMARFPFVDGPARRDALDRCAGSFDRWRRDQPGIERVDVDLPGGRVRCWAGGLSATDRKPLVLFVGGTISIKEQWAPNLRLARRLGLTMLVTEMPSVGENTLRYDAGSWRMLPAVLDAVADRADVSRTYAVAVSFSGHLALRAAANDPRLRGAVTAGAPIREFFTDPAWFAALPRITVDTLAHLTATPAAELPAHFARGWALDPQTLAGLDIPVCCTAATRDEIIPPGDVALLRDHVRELYYNEFDDEHGSPRHVAENRLWVVESLLRIRGGRGPQRALLGLLRSGLRLRRRWRTTTHDERPKVMR
jgi:esterase FrsA